MRAGELVESLSTLPPVWQAALPGWTDGRLRDVARCVAEVSGDRPIAPDDPFRALRLVAPGQVRVVIVGQDPYPTAGHADGLAFSAGRGRPRSLARIFEVLAADRAGFVPPSTWNLDDWARRGVLLLNPALTVEVGRSGSHLRCGWQALTRELVASLLDRPESPVFLLWGTRAQAFFAEAASASATGGSSATTFVSRHPSYDFRRQFMADGSHFAATAHLVDWWAIGRPVTAVL